jgi:hypothetical protein
LQIGKIRHLLLYQCQHLCELMAIRVVGQLLSIANWGVQNRARVRPLIRVHVQRRRRPYAARGSR